MDYTLLILNLCNYLIVLDNSLVYDVWYCIIGQDGSLTSDIHIYLSDSFIDGLSYVVNQ